MKSISFQKFLAIPVLTALLLAAGGCSKSAKVERYIEKAENFIAQGNYASAEIELKNALKSDSQNPVAIAAMGRVYFDQGRLRDAYQFLNVLKDAAPNDIESRARLASIQLAAGLRKEAGESAAIILKQDPTHVEAILALAESVDSFETLADVKNQIRKLPDSAAKFVGQALMQIKSRALDSADELLNKALEIDPDFPSAHSGKFIIHLAREEKEAAEEALKKAADSADTRTGHKIRYAQFLIQKPDLEAARNYLSEINKAAPDYLPALSLYAEQLAQNNEKEKALELTNQALKLDPIDPTAMRIKGALLVLDLKYDAAIEQLEKTLEFYPKDLKAKYQLALAYIAKNDLGRAKSRLAGVVAEAPQNLEATVLLANLQVRDQDFSGAIITLKAFIEQSPKSVEAQMILADIYNKQGNNEEAIAIYSNLDRAIPNTAQFDYLSGLSHLQLEDRNSARISFEEALAQNPKHFQSVEQLTALDLREKKHESALERINRTIDVAPEDSTLHVIKGQIQKAMNDNAAAEASYRRALELDSKNRSAYLLFNAFLQSQGRTDEALQKLETALEFHPKDVGILSNIAGIHETAGRKDKAIEFYEHILTIEGEYLPALNNLAYLYSDMDGMAEKALALAQKARKAAPNDAFTADTLGWIMYKRKDYNRALSLLRESATKLPNNPEVAYHLGATHYTLGNIDSALEHLNKATSGEQKYAGLSDANDKLKILQIDAAAPTAEDIRILESRTNSSEKDPLALATLGNIRLISGEFKSSIPLFKQALEANPENLAAKLGLANAYSLDGNKEEAIRLAKEATRHAPNNQQAAYTQGKVALRTGDYVWAASILQDIARKDSENSEVFEYLAEANLAIGQIESAQTAVTQAKALGATGAIHTTSDFLDYILDKNASQKPSSEGLTGLLPALANAVSSHRTGDLKAAQTEYESILKTYTEQAQAKLGLANILIDNGSNFEKAYQLATEVRRKFPDNVESKALQGIARYRQGQFKQAVQNFAGIPSDRWSTPSWELYYGLSLKETGKNDQAKLRIESAISKGLSEAESALALAALN